MSRDIKVRHATLVGPDIAAGGREDQDPRSPDGKYWWDGQKRNPVEQPALLSLGRLIEQQGSVASGSACRRSSPAS